MEVCKICPKCQKDFSGSPYWKSNMKKHLERKNPCDRKKDEKYMRESKKKELPKCSRQYVLGTWFCPGF
jgi:hypothetical protein